MAEHTYVCDRKPDQCGKDSAVRFAPRTVWQEAQAQSRAIYQKAPPEIREGFGYSAKVALFRLLSVAFHALTGTKSQRRKLLILSRLALLGFLPRLPLNIRQTRIPALLVQCRTISPLLLKAREKRTAPCRNSPLTKDTKSCFVIKPPVYLSVLFCVFFSSAFLSNAIYSGKTWNGIKGKTGRPPFSTSFIADNMRSDILFLAIESGVTVSGCPTT